MTLSRPLVLGSLVRQAILAGIGAGVLLGLYLWATAWLPEHLTPAIVAQRVAAAAVGKAALADPRFIWVGLAIHGIVSLVWAGAYAYLAARQPTLRERWIPSGAIYGIVVYIIMQFVLFAGGTFEPKPNPTAFLNDVLAHAVFFGLPVAYIVRAMQAVRPDA